MMEKNIINRRKFIKGSAAAMAGATLYTSAQAQVQTSDSKAFAGSGYNYRLPSFKTGSRLLFQGDSITDMQWGRNQKDRNHYLGHSYVYLIAARLGADMPGAQLDIYNRGGAGHSVSHLRGRWQRDAVNMKPDLLSVLIGTNDVGNGIQPVDFESDYRQILDASRKANPDLRIVLMDPFILKCGPLKEDRAWATRRTATDKIRVVVEQLAKDYDAVHIKTQDIFDAAADAVSAEHWMWDGIHPLPQGHELIARNWIDAVSARW